jgi:proteasome lid subunit RPN8/RPN11
MNPNEQPRQPERVRLPRSLANAILDHVRETPEQEVCGLITAAGGEPRHCLRIDNIASDPRDRYVMDPERLVRALYELEQTNASLFAIYHSHPMGEAAPSATDIAEAGYPEAVYLIVSLGTRGVMEIRAWRIGNGLAREVELVIA